MKYIGIQGHTLKPQALTVAKEAYREVERQGACLSLKRKPRAPSAYRPGRFRFRAVLSSAGMGPFCGALYERRPRAFP